MTRAKELLDAATPLPWHVGYDGGSDNEGASIVAPIFSPQSSWTTVDNERTEAARILLTARVRNAADGALIVYAVNRLPDYEAAVEGLEAVTSGHDTECPLAPCSCGVTEKWDAAVAALARLREGEAASVR